MNSETVVFWLATPTRKMEAVVQNAGSHLPDYTVSQP
jgi:hypothetical protein